jgi:hypothetical protein
MRRIGLAVVLAIGLALAPLSGEAQQAAKIAQIGSRATFYTAGMEHSPTSAEHGPEPSIPA